jgi:hypothetical protein
MQEYILSEPVHACLLEACFHLCEEVAASLCWKEATRRPYGKSTHEARLTEIFITHTKEAVHVLEVSRRKPVHSRNNRQSRLLVLTTMRTQMLGSATEIVRALSCSYGSQCATLVELEF